MNIRTAIFILSAGILLFIGGLVARGADTYNIDVKTWFDLPSLYGGQASIRNNTAHGPDYNTVYAGQFEATFLGGAPEGHALDWVTYCTDIDNYLYDGEFTMHSLEVAQGHPDWQNPDWAPGGIARATQLFEAHRDQVNNAASAVALQLGIWEVLYDEHPSLSSGSFRARDDGTTPGAVALATSWLGEPLPSLTGGEVWWEPTDQFGDHREAQGLLGRTMIVPEPSAMSIMSVLGVLLFWRCRSVFLRRR